MGATDSRAQIAADAIGSVRAEGLDPGITVTNMLDRWIEGKVETEELGRAAQLLAAGDSIDGLLNGRQTVPTGR